MNALRRFASNATASVQVARRMASTEASAAVYDATPASTPTITATKPYPNDRGKPDGDMLMVLGGVGIGLFAAYAFNLLTAKALPHSTPRTDTDEWRADTEKMFVERNINPITRFANQKK
eukprot:TRINITY_DN789_c0_g1_i1.p2 TRINITY_DN789_c0_g1~~TRINITY_DN789_c0_g1_i1.p2  ORF type:complete len:120 (-),score=27.80 TRINITY_DN789_c0_g1_i1:979-1338(-)